MKVRSVVRRIGNSLGVVIPKEEVEMHRDSGGGCCGVGSSEKVEPEGALWLTAIFEKDSANEGRSKIRLGRVMAAWRASFLTRTQ